MKLVRFLLIASLIVMSQPALAGEMAQPGLEHRIRQAEQVLKQAGRNSARWHNRRARIERDVHDIAYLIERAMKAGDRATTAEYAREAHNLLERAINRGHFHPDDVAPIANELRGLVEPNM